MAIFTCEPLHNIRFSRRNLTRPTSLRLRLQDTEYFLMTRNFVHFQNKKYVADFIV